MRQALNHLSKDTHGGYVGRSSTFMGNSVCAYIDNILEHKQTKKCSRDTGNKRRLQNLVFLPLVLDMQDWFDSR